VYFFISRITGYYDPGQLRHAGCQGIDLSCHLPISTFVALCDHNPSVLQKDGWTSFVRSFVRLFVPSRVASVLVH